MKTKKQILAGGDFLIYQTDDGTTRIEVRMQNESVWLTQKQMAELFSKDSDTIGLHIRNIYKEGELMPEGTTEESSVVQNEGGRQVQRNVCTYNLDVIISVGYRVKSHRSTQFRQWATQRLREYIIKGFTMDDQRLKQAGGGNYFDELLARIRSSPCIWSLPNCRRYLAHLYMADWITKLNDFLKLSGREILTHTGKISHESALAKAHTEYESYRQQLLKEPSRVELDFLNVVKALEEGGRTQGIAPTVKS